MHKNGGEYKHWATADFCTKCEPFLISEPFLHRVWAMPSLHDSQPSAKTPVLPQSLPPTMRLRRRRTSKKWVKEMSHLKSSLTKFSLFKNRLCTGARNLRPYSANHQLISLSWRKLHGVGYLLSIDFLALFKAWIQYTLIVIIDNSVKGYIFRCQVSSGPEFGRSFAGTFLMF